MKSASIYNEKHQWVYFGRDPEKPEKIIETVNTAITPVLIL